MANVRKGTGPGYGHLGNQPPSREGSLFGNSSSPPFSVYSKFADQNVNAMAEQRKHNDPIIIFASVFFMVVSTLLLFQSRNLSVPNPFIAAMLPTFSPPQSFILLNILLVLSLSIFLTCALILKTLPHVESQVHRTLHRTSRT
ncbi:hypothetical protein DFH94DRAFT_703217 [Russula ochroleuca]|uniref:Transmembrane protein n=1 Tax=Russula ochroleuca TaxID=152965 RepID=A0A9P5N601_9AGAM|nr:hypothetical protein DFH94DRAFT_789227 [Russula ochroleuca]KAF8487125.1 hypothetical protein DFH94DRAFT_703217 [Russula ochroleuca]